MRRAILSHAGFEDCPRLTRLEKALFACDELAGFLTAVSYVKPGRSIHEVELKSVKKKLKDNSSRDEDLHVETEAFVIIAEPSGRNPKTVASAKSKDIINPAFGSVDWR